MSRIGMLPVLLALIVLQPLPLRAQDCPPADVPDPLYQDTNFDGIDGDTARAVFVSDAAGDDLNPGTMSLPVRTIAQGILLASSFSPARDVYVAGGSYVLTGTLEMVSGVSLFGRYDGPPGWQRSDAETTTISGVTPVLGFSAIDIETHVEGFVISAAAGSGSGGSSHGIAVDSSAGPIFIRYNTILAGAGAPGIPGADGVGGDSGANGWNGMNGSCDGGNGGGGPGGVSACGRNGGKGGAGGPEGLNAGQTGDTGVGGTIGGSGGLPAGGSFSCPAASPGLAGGNGLPGSPGIHGGMSPAIGSFSGTSYLPAPGSAGTDGGHGDGGGGGGGGGGQGGIACNDGGGNGGGGGGGGGCGGTHGGGGGGGGGSFGIVSFSSDVIIDGNTIVTQPGGAGGDGGNGGAGGGGGGGGLGATNCTAEVGAGGNGGNGGAGGDGGSGSGGSGGPSIGIVSLGVPLVTLGSNAITVDSGGPGGSGGASGFGSAPTGSQGTSVAVSGSTDTLLPTQPIACVTDASVGEPAEGTTTATFFVYLSSAAASLVQIDYATDDSSATAGQDYAAGSGTLSFPPGDVMEEVVVQIYADSFVEPDEVFFLKLTSASGATFADTIGRAQVADSAILAEYPVRAQWNLLSLPLAVSNDSVDALFPTAVSSAFGFEPGTGYVGTDTLANGPGYWLKFAADQTVGLGGFALSADTVPVGPGWNLIGSITDSVQAAGVVTIPPGLISSPFYGYEGGYVIRSVLRPSEGYWVKVSDSGRVVLSASTAAFPARTVSPAARRDAMNRIRVVDAAGHSRTLSFGADRGGPVPEPAELPPVPPRGAFDARFSSGRDVLIFPTGHQGSYPIRIQADEYPVRITWEIVGYDQRATLRVAGASHELDRDGEAFLISPDASVELVAGGAAVAPDRFELGQNFPNPFNPTTRIPFILREDVHVRLTVHNVLGQEMATLVDEDLRAGHHQVEWDAADVPGGVYFYRIRAGQFTETRKFLYLR